MSRYSSGDRVRCPSGQTGTIKYTYGDSGLIIYVVQCDGDGQLLEKFEIELAPAVDGLTTGLA